MNLSRIYSFWKVRCYLLQKLHVLPYQCPHSIRCVVTAAGCFT
jgi:hypothetical protein